VFLTATACRDPIFWRWHYYIELIFRRQKDTLGPYTSAQLLFDEIRVSGVEVRTPSLDTNNLLTFWMQSDVDLSRGLDMQRTDVNSLGPIWARLTHLQHRDFEYHFTVRNGRPTNVTGTVRIFIAPKLDEQGDPLPFFEQRHLFYQLDKYTTVLRPGDNVLERRSVDSALTIPWGQTFRRLERDVATPSGVQAFCGCGWPQHMLISKGKHEGLPMDLFVMVSDWEVDRVHDPKAVGLTDTELAGCQDAVVLCGAFGRKYPDSRAMGYPFDRLAPGGGANTDTTTLADFISPYYNMSSTEVKIFHRDVTLAREGGAAKNARVVDLEI